MYFLCLLTIRLLIVDDILVIYVTTHKYWDAYASFECKQRHGLIGVFDVRQAYPGYKTTLYITVLLKRHCTLIVQSEINLRYKGGPSSFREQNRESTEEYSRWKIKKRYGKFEHTGFNKRSINKSQKGRNQVSGRVSVPWWHVTPVANALWKLLVIRWRSRSVIRSWIGGRYGRFDLSQVHVSSCYHSNIMHSRVCLFSVQKGRVNYIYIIWLVVGLLFWWFTSL